MADVEFGGVPSVIALALLYTPYELAFIEGVLAVYFTGFAMREVV
jgi:hypothetical protein